jgi:hypothetical protein
VPHAGYPFRPLGQMCQAWADEFEAEYAAAGADSRIDPGLARAGIAAFRALPDTADRQVLLCTDLHADNILAARRAPRSVCRPPCLVFLSGTDHVALRVEAATAGSVRVPELPPRAANRTGPRRP